MKQIMALINYKPITYPKMSIFSQLFETPTLNDISERITRETEKINLKSLIKNGETVAITAGSRNVSNISEILLTIANEIKKAGGKPFIVPAMGSHGGASAEGQENLLKHLGITEQSVGCPVCSTMEVVKIGEINQFRHSFPVYMDKHAYKADHIVVVNKIRPHTDFKADFGSGMMKMMCIGLGKHAGALIYHKAIASFGYANIIKAVAKKVLNTRKILFGLGIVENHYKQTVNIKAALAEQIIETESALFKQAAQYFHGLPFDEADILIVDEMGKDISGSGMDPNVHGRLHSLSDPPFENPKIKRIFVRDLTANSHGNATGIGFADFTTNRLTDKIDFTATYINCLTGIDPEDARVPITFDTDQEAIDAALNTIGFIEPENAKIIWIKNTRDLETIAVSEAYLKDSEEKKNLKRLCFDKKGNLPLLGNFIL